MNSAPFEPSSSPHDLGMRKPDPETFRSVATLMRFEPGEILFLDHAPRMLWEPVRPVCKAWLSGPSVTFVGHSHRSDSRSGLEGSLVSQTCAQHRSGETALHNSRRVAVVSL